MALADDLFRATGMPGLKGSRTGFIYEEFLGQLRAQPGARQYREMADNDPVIGGILWAIEAMCRKVEWRLEAADQSSAALDGAQFANEVLFQDMSRPFSGLIEDGLTMLVYGYAPMETVWKRRNGYQAPLLLTPSNAGARPQPAVASSRFDDGRIGIDRVFLINQDTIFRWYFDATGQWFGLEQVTEDCPSISIPRQKLLNFRTTGRLDNPEGRSILRSSYVPYTRKKTIEIAMGRLAMNAAGIVDVAIPAKYLDEQADDGLKAVRTMFETAGQNLAQNKVGSFLRPSDGYGANGENPQFSIKFISTDNRNSADQVAILDMYDRRIAMSVLADFLLIGQATSGGGSRALVDNRSSFFGSSVVGLLRSIKDELNRTLLPRLWRLNGLPDATMPQLEHDDLEVRDLDQMAQYLTALSNAGAPLFPDTKLENKLRADAGLPPVDEDQREEDRELLAQLQPPAPVPPAGTVPPPAGGVPAPPGPPPAPAPSPAPPP